MPILFDSVMLAPCNNDFATYELLRSVAAYFEVEGGFVDQDFGVKLVNLNLAAPLLIHLSTSFSLAFVTTAPYLFFEIWRFVNPALYPAERSGVGRIFLFGSFMFYVGLIVGYYLIFPLTLRFLASYQLSELIETTLSIESYMDNFTMLLLSMGIAFELPLMLWLLSLMGIVSRPMLRRYRRHAVVAIVIVAAVITPTSDPFTLAIVALPLYMLYELSLIIVRDTTRQPQDL